MKIPFFIGICGGSASGKTTFALGLCKRLGLHDTAVLLQDNYYIDQSKSFDGDGGSINYDHPNAIDFPLLLKHMQQLKRKEDIQAPIYDFKTHRRKKETVHLEPKPFVIVDGILLFADQPVRDFFDVRVFIDTNEDIRFARRLKRDVEERGRQEDGVRKQFAKYVKPMHDQFIEPNKVFADKAYTGVGSFDPAYSDFFSYLREKTHEDL